MDLDRLLQNQREYFRSGATLPVDFRVAMLKKLRGAVERHEEEIAAALRPGAGCIRRWRSLRPPAIKSRLLTEMCSS